MVAVSNPFGCQPAYSNNGNIAARPYSIASGYAANILKYSPVKLISDGTLQAAAAGDVDIIGIFAGVTWIDAQGVPHSSDMWTTGTVTTTNSSPFFAWVWDDPTMVFNIQCDATLALSTGSQVDFSNTTAGSTTTGLSACTAAAAGDTTSGQNQLRVVGIGTQIGNAWGDAFPIIQVQIAQHQYVSNKTAV